MGMTQSFYYVQNLGLSKETLAEMLQKRVKRSGGKFSGLEKLMTPGLLAQFTKVLEETAKSMHSDGAFIAYRDGEEWLPYFESDLCEGYTASSEDAGKLSAAFDAPVLALSVFDSDVMFLSYADVARNIAYDYAKSNFEECEEYDDERYSTELPEFLIEFCGEDQRERLREIWEEPDLIFAEDRILHLTELLKIPIAEWAEEMPEGFEKIQ